MRARSSGAPGRHRRAWIRPRRADPLLGLVLSSSPMAGDPDPRDAFHEMRLKLDSSAIRAELERLHNRGEE